MNANKLKSLTAGLTAALICGGLAAWQTTAAEKPAAPAADTSPERILAEKFAEVQKLIKPRPGESLWNQIPWQNSLWEARRIAAAEGKPIFIWSGSGGAPCVFT
jgi:hypothetical protein